MKRTLTHIDREGKAKMVDVSNKEITERTAIATGKVEFPSEVFAILKEQGFTGKKGSIIQTAVIAGIQGVKQTSNLIPMCHPLPVTGIDITIEPGKDMLEIRCKVKCQGKTGVEMEALNGVSVSALTIYDMCKALSHDIHITGIQLEHKTGGKSDFDRSGL
ncbi:cyclic pyranopterin monophosphate synthase MoaC [Robertkochia marina]|uniref:Cyclic pyranopterin monophosphate synthase n=1 Tax=Robertkochia marina TaxID=1227945 RepID=A0A4S3M3R1_9FLAO|nr:cyclic pyranopterin monophosphate synthase MoaC [Robertkochia marina]THD69822.1 cyclic pyranopterin monophosphate synthase MoaC [Robertkochia marina]TRZ46833.1 cyclic pyranopterin monophosphate synthase MoaC [Robertkochia marina]